MRRNGLRNNSVIMIEICQKCCKKYENNVPIQEENNVPI